MILLLDILFMLFINVWSQQNPLYRSRSLPQSSNREGLLRLVGGQTLFEGNVEINHLNRWGMICDDEWDIDDADVVCKQMGFILGAVLATANSRYGPGRNLIWMDNVICNGTESSLLNCLFDGWQIHDCDRNEAAGVICRVNLNQVPIREKPITSIKKVTQKPPSQNLFDIKTLQNLFGDNIKVRLRNNSNQGYVEIYLDNNWQFICADGWGINEANVVCKQLKLGSAESFFVGPARNRLSLVSGIKCNGTESNISKCYKVTNNYCHDNKLVGIVCGLDLPDLVPNVQELERSVFIEDRSIMYLQCALEENCLSKSAYEIDKRNPNWINKKRRLLRFTANIKNIGKVDFRPFKKKIQWQWHSCHRHYHSMEVFATFDILDQNGKRVAQGHKASFCLEDNECETNQIGKYACANYGDQGISVNCVDIYKYDLDCQWIDITDILPGLYQLKITINPEKKVPEMTFDNNAVLCSFQYGLNSSQVSNCILASA